MLISLSTTSLIGQTLNNIKDNKPYITTNSFGDTVVNNLPISFIKKANIKNQENIDCKEDLDSCNAQVEKLNKRSILYIKDLELAEREKEVLKAQVEDLQRALNTSKNSKTLLQEKLDKQIKIRNFVIPFFTAATLTSGIMTGLYLWKRN